MQYIFEMIINYWLALISFNFNGSMTDNSIVMCQYVSLIKNIMFRIPSLFVARSSVFVLFAELKSSVVSE